MCLMTGMLLQQNGVENKMSIKSWLKRDNNWLFVLEVVVIVVVGVGVRVH